MNSAGSYQPITAESYAKLALLYAGSALPRLARIENCRGPRRPRWQWPNQALSDAATRYAIDTAINASKNINTPPTMGSTMGIIGTMASVASGASGAFSGAAS